MLNVSGEDSGSPGKIAAGSGLKRGFQRRAIFGFLTGFHSLFVKFIELYTFHHILYFKKNLSKIGK